MNSDENAKKYPKLKRTKGNDDEGGIEFAKPHQEKIDFEIGGIQITAVVDVLGQDDDGEYIDGLFDDLAHTERQPDGTVPKRKMRRSIDGKKR